MQMIHEVAVICDTLINTHRLTTFDWLCC